MSIDHELIERMEDTQFYDVMCYSLPSSKKTALIALEEKCPENLPKELFVSC